MSMTNEVNSVIDHLCAKLGTTSNMLISELAKLKVTQNAFLVILSSIVLVLSAHYIKVAWKYDKENDFDSLWFLIPATFFVGFFIAFVVGIYELIGWLTSPTAMSIILISGALN